MLVKSTKNNNELLTVEGALVDVVAIVPDVNNISHDMYTSILINVSSCILSPHIVEDIIMTRPVQQMNRRFGSIRKNVSIACVTTSIHILNEYTCTECLSKRNDMDVVALLPHGLHFLCTPMTHLLALQP